MNLNAIEYKNPPERFTELRKKLLLRSAIFIAVMLIFSAIIFFFAGDREYAVSITIPITYLTFVLAVLLFSVFRNLKRQKAIYNSYKLIISDHSITREQNNLHQVAILLTAVKEVKKDTWGNLMVKGYSPHEVIVISPYVENFIEIKNWLENEYSVSIQKGKGPLINYLMMVGVVVTMLIFYEVQDKVIVIMSGMILLITLIWSIYKIQTSPLVEKRTKRMSWWTIVVIASIAASMYFRLFPVNL